MTSPAVAISHFFTFVHTDHEVNVISSCKNLNYSNDGTLPATQKLDFKFKGYNVEFWAASNNSVLISQVEMKAWLKNNLRNKKSPQMSVSQWATLVIYSFNKKKKNECKRIRMSVMSIIHYMHCCEYAFQYTVKHLSIDAEVENCESVYLN